MRRIIFSALIGGLVGIAVLLNGAMSKAGCWSHAQRDFWQLLPSQHADAYFQVSDLMIKSQMLLIKKELAEFGFEYFMRAAALGLLSLLIVEQGAKKWNVREFISSRLNCTGSTSEPASNQVWFTIFLPALFPTIILLVVAQSFFSGGYLDAMSIAILLPVSLLLALIVAAAQKKRLFPWQQCIDWKDSITGKLSREAWSIICLAAIIPCLAVLTVTVFFLADGYMDATTIAILVPALVLNALVMAAAYKKRLFPWQVKISVQDEDSAGTLNESISYTNLRGQATGQLVTYLLAPPVACGVLALCSHYIHWSNVGFWMKPNSIDRSFEIFVQALAYDMNNILVSIFVTGILLYLSEVLLYRKRCGGELFKTAFSSGPIFNAFLMSWFLFWLLPAVLPIVLNHPLPIYSERTIARELFRVCSSLSTIVASMTGLAVALAGNEKVAAFLSLVAKSPASCFQRSRFGMLNK